jgi:rRNA-processing protein FCF1
MISLPRSVYELFESARRSLQGLYSAIRAYLFLEDAGESSDRTRASSESRPKVRPDFTQACPRSVRDGVIKKLVGRRLIIDSNILMHWKGQMVAKAIAKACAASMDKIFVPASQWRELQKGSKHQDRTKARRFADALLLLARFERSGVIARESEVSVQPFYSYADDEMVAHIAGWTRRGVPCALVSCDIELGNRVRAVAARCAKGLVLLINQTVIGPMVGHQSTMYSEVSARPTPVAV